MNRLMFAALTTALLAVNPAASADGGHGPGYGRSPGYHNSGNHSGYHNSGYHAPYNYGAYHYPAYGHRPYYPHGYYPYRPYYYPYRPHYYHPAGWYPYYPYYPYGGYHHNNDNHSDWPAYLAGGLIIGALVTNAYNKSQTTYPQTQTAPAAPVGSVQGRHLLRDLNGKCYERQTDANGNELRTELPPSECNW